MKKFQLLMLTLAISVSGCSTIEQQFSDVPKQVAEAQASLAAAEHTALIYASLPVCGKTSLSLCRDPHITEQIGYADVMAYNAVAAARQSETQTDADAALTALKALTSLTDNIPIAKTVEPAQ